MPARLIPEAMLERAKGPALVDECIRVGVRLLNRCSVSCQFHASFMPVSCQFHGPGSQNKPPWSIEAVPGSIFFAPVHADSSLAFTQDVMSLHSCFTKNMHWHFQLQQQMPSVLALLSVFRATPPQRGRAGYCLPCVI